MCVCVCVRERERVCCKGGLFLSLIPNWSPDGAEFYNPE